MPNGDVLIFGCDNAQHDKRLIAAMKWIEAAGVTLNSEKCDFDDDGKSRVKFLGHVIDQEGIRADPEKNFHNTSDGSTSQCIRVTSIPGDGQSAWQILPLCIRTHPATKRALEHKTKLDVGTESRGSIFTSKKSRADQAHSANPVQPDCSYQSIGGWVVLQDWCRSTTTSG